MKWIDRLLKLFKIPDNNNEYSYKLDTSLQENDLHVYIPSQEQKERWQKQKEEKELRKKQCDTFRIEDMYQFPEIPFEWQWVIKLNHTDGIAWFMLNMNNQYIALSAINFINEILEDSKRYTDFNEELYICTENIDFGYPITFTLKSTTCTFVECTPYTKTGKISKYPAILHFKENPERHIYNDSACYVYRVHGEIYFMADGNIGKCDLVINDYWIKIRLKGLNLVVQRIGKNTLNGNIDIYRAKL